jgi:Rnl2 family RNA ligase
MVYGEFFGGMYPHPDVAPHSKLQAIQTGVYYAPSIEFCAFDIAIEEGDAGSNYYLDYETALSYFERHEIMRAKPLFTGNFSVALNFDTRINSTIPALLNLPELQDNLIEGVVVKPFNQQRGSTVKSRPIAKLKNAEFDAEKKFHQAEKWTYIPGVSSKTNDLSFIVDELRNYVTHNRLESAISKIGALDFDNPTRMEEIEAALLRDTLADFNGDNDNLLDELSSEEQAWIQERIDAEIERVVAEENAPN